MTESKRWNHYHEIPIQVLEYEYLDRKKIINRDDSYLDEINRLFNPQIAKVDHGLKFMGETRYVECTLCPRPIPTKDFLEGNRLCGACKARVKEKGQIDCVQYVEST